jgi:hypothetical protein
MKYLLLILSIFMPLSCERSVEIAGGGNEEITGWVGRKDGLPAGECLIMLRKIDEFRRVDTGAAGIYKKMLSSESGEFRFDRIISGKYSIEFNDNDTLGKLVTVTVTPGESLSVTEYVEPYGALYGRIDSSVINVSTGLAVFAVEIKRSVKVDPSGHFEFNKLPPGSYTLLVDDGDSIITPLTDTSRIQVDQNDTVYIVNVGAAAAGANSTFEKYFSAGAALEEIRAVVQQQDSGFILCGKANIASDGRGNGWLLKVSSSGDEVWSYLLKDSSESELQSVISLPDGGCLACGGVGVRSDYSNCSGWVVRFDKSGKALWSKTYAMISGGMFNAMTPASDGNFLLCGNGILSDGSAGSSGWIVKIDINGDTLWSKSISNLGLTVAFNSIVQIPGGEIAICGVFRSDTSYIEKGLFLKADSAIRNYTFKGYSGEGYNGGFVSFIQTNEPGFVFSGFTEGNTDTTGGWLVKTDGDGNSLWSKTYPVKNPKAFCTGYDGSYSIGGSGVVMKIDGNGNEIRSTTVTDKIAMSMQKTFDGGFIVGGYTSATFKQGDRGDGWVMKFQENGNHD